MSDSTNSTTKLWQGSNLRPVRVNWAFYTGAILIIFVIAIAIWGPKLARHDPLKENYIIRSGDEWISTPLAPFQLPDYPLGTDSIGRDTLSQLLWAVRPTLILVSIVAIVRLLIGLLLGLLAGWEVGTAGRLLDGLISTALAIPVLIVALAIIAAIGIQFGVQAFILGLSATGWADTARMVREQTRSIKGQAYIEAARALGCSNRRLLFRNILRHIMPMIWMLFAFEISSTLLTIATLGFLGYFIGGEVWTPISDTSASRSSGMPELGLMVATVSSDIFVGPWKMVAAGTVIFITILGFNLLGEGLRLRLNQPRRKAGLLVNLQESLSMWWEEKLFLPGRAWMVAHPAWRISAIVLFLGCIVGLAWWRIDATQNPPALTALAIPGNQLWATDRRDPYGSLHSPATSLKNPKIEWKRNIPGGTTGGPVITSDGIAYVASLDWQLLAFQANGTNVWTSPARLVGNAIGTPALSSEGRIYVSTFEGTLNAVSPGGELLWAYSPAEQIEGTSGPVIDNQGNIYYMRVNRLEAVSPQGKGLWSSIARSTRTTQAPALTPDESGLLVQEALLAQKDGRLIEISNLPKSEQFMVGGDGRNYGRSGNLVYEWRFEDGIPQVVRQIEWDAQTYSFDKPRDSGVTASGLIWLLYYSSREDARLIWLDQAGNVISQARFPHRPTRLIATDRDSTAYLCGSLATGKAECLAIRPGEEKPLWQIELPQGKLIAGGALLDSKMYVTLSEGLLYVIGEDQP